MSRDRRKGSKVGRDQAVGLPQPPQNFFAGPSGLPHSEQNLPDFTMA